jgi:AcrR family transcriptional regulator
LSIVNSTVGGDTRIDGRRSRWDAHRVARRAELIDAAVAAIARHGPGGGLDEIAALAGTRKPVLYRYFADKTDLWRAVSSRVVEHVIEALRAVAATRPPPEELLRASVDAYLGLLEAHPQLYRFVMAHPEIDTDAGPAPFRSVIAEVIGEQSAQHLAAAGLDPSLARPWADGVVGFIDAASLWWLDAPQRVDRMQLAAHLSALLWGGAAGVYQGI